MDFLGGVDDGAIWKIWDLFVFVFYNLHPIISQIRKQLCCGENIPSVSILQVACFIFSEKNPKQTNKNPGG